LCILETQANIQQWVLAFNSQHLAPIIRTEVPFGFYYYPIRQEEVRGVGSSDYVTKASSFVLKLKATL